MGKINTFLKGIFSIFETMGIIKFIKGLPERRKHTDYNKIRVTSNGAFYMKSEDIFDDITKSKELTSKLRSAVKAYEKRTLKDAVK